MTVTETLTLGSNTGITSFPAQLHFVSGGFTSGSTVAIPQHEPSGTETKNISEAPHAILSMVLQLAARDLRDVDEEIARAFDATIQDGIDEGH